MNSRQGKPSPAGEEQQAGQALTNLCLMAWRGKGGSGGAGVAVPAYACRP